MVIKNIDYPVLKKLGYDVTPFEIKKIVSGSELYHDRVIIFFTYDNIGQLVKEKPFRVYVECPIRSILTAERIMEATKIATNDLEKLKGQL